MHNKYKCRTCLSTSDNVRPLSTAVTVANTKVCLTDILQNFYNYKVKHEDGWPDGICLDCVYQLTITYSFKVLIDASAKTLENFNTVESSKDNSSETDSDSNLNIPEEKTSQHSIYHRQPLNITQPLYCTICKEQFDLISLLYDHYLKLHTPKNTVGRDCEYCNEKLKTFRELIVHRKQHLSPFVCEICWKSFQFVEEQDNHSCIDPNETSKEPEKILKQCDTCGKSYPRGYFPIHLKIHSNTRRYSCSYCPQKFKVRCSLNSHVLWKHKHTRNHKCNVCNATFVSASSRSAHIRKHHLKEKKHTCESCGKRFFSKSETERHMLSHTGVKNFHCHFCTKSYQTRYGLNVHLRVHTHLPSSSYIQWKC